VGRVLLCRPAVHETPEGPATAPLFVLIRTHLLRLVLATSLFWPSHAYAQAKDAFVQGLTQLINAVDGTIGDEGPALQAAVEAMSRGLADWEAGRDTDGAGGDLAPDLAWQAERVW